MVVRMIKEELRRTMRSESNGRNDFYRDEKVFPDRNKTKEGKMGCRWAAAMEWQR